MRSYTAPITEENFSEAWKWIARKRRWSIKKELIRRVSVSIAQIVYFFLFLILTFGVFYEMGGSFVRIYINQIPQAGIWWNQLSAPILADASTEAMRILRCAGILYLLPFCTVIPPVLLIVLLYHPRTPKQTGDKKQDAWQLRSLAKHAQVYAQKKENNTATTCSFFMGILMCLFVLGLLLFAYANPSMRDQVVAEAHLANLRCFLYGAAMFFCYRIVNIPLVLMLKALHFCHVPASIVTDTETYYNQVNSQEPAATENKGDA